MRARLRWYGTRATTLGVALVAGGVLLLLLLLQHFFGDFRLVGGQPAPPPRARELWLPGAADLLETATERRTQAWRRVVGSRAPLRRGAAALTESAGRLLVVPDGRRIDEREVAALRRFVGEGGALVLSGSLGVRDANDQWLGYRRMLALLDVARVAPLPRERAAAIVAQRRGPLAASLPPGARVPLRAELGVPAIPGSEAELAWAITGSDAKPLALGASRRFALGRGRLAWLAAGPEHVREDAEDSHPDFHEVLGSALAWAAGEPVVEVLPQRAREASGPPSQEASRRWRELDARVAVSTRRVGAWRLLLSVTHRGTGMLEAAALRLYLDGPLETASIAATELGQDVPELRVRPGDGRIDLALPTLSPGSHSWHLDWKPQEPSSYASLR